MAGTRTAPQASGHRARRAGRAAPADWDRPVPGRSAPSVPSRPERYVTVSSHVKNSVRDAGTRPPRRSGCPGWLEVPLDLGLELRLRQSPDDPVHDGAVAQDDQRRDARGVASAREALVLVDVDLDH